MGRYVRDSNKKPIFTLILKDTKDDNWLPIKENMDYLDRTLVHAKELVTKLEECITGRDKYISKEDVKKLIFGETQQGRISVKSYNILIDKIDNLN